MNFSNIARQLNEGVSLDAAASAAEKATTGGQKQKEGTMNAREKQKSQMAAQQNTPVKSDVSYASEEARKEREYAKMLTNESSDWRKELIEAAQPDEEGNHPYVDVMPFMNQKQQEAKRQMKGAMKAGQGQQKDAQQPSGLGEALSVEDQMKVSRDYFKKRAARSPEEKASQEKKDASSRAKNFAANRNNNIGQMDHSKKND